MINDVVTFCEKCATVSSKQTEVDNGETKCTFYFTYLFAYIIVTSLFYQLALFGLLFHLFNTSFYYFHSHNKNEQMSEQNKYTNITITTSFIFFLIQFYFFKFFF